MDTQADLRSLYDTDEYEWLLHQAAALTGGRLHEIDRKNLAEYLTDMAKREVRELASRLQILLMHLLKYRYQPKRAGWSWMLTIEVQQDEVRRLLADNPSLRRKADNELYDAYRQARRLAAIETKLSIETFPESCSWTIDEALDPAASLRIEWAITHGKSAGQRTLAVLDSQGNSWQVASANSPLHGPPQHESKAERILG